MLSELNINNARIIIITIKVFHDTLFFFSGLFSEEFLLQQFISHLLCDDKKNDLSSLRDEELS